jgi:protein CpxP
MSLRNKLIGASLTAALLSAFAVTAAAQQPQGPPNDRGPRSERMRGPGRQDREGREGMRGREMGPGLLRELNLTDAQKEQLRAAGKQNREANRAQHEELRQLAEKRRQGSLTAAEEARVRALRDEMRASMQKSHEGLLSILTAEQRTKLEQLRSERMQHRDEMRERHQNRDEKSVVKAGELQ